jgi:Flp pilus assembly protein TadG
MGSRRAGDRGHKRIFCDRGAAAVEAAIVTPLVMALFFGIVELGFLFKDYLAVAASVRAGVRIASASPRISNFAQAAANQVAQTGGAMDFNDVQQLWVYKVDPLPAQGGTGTNKPIGFTDFSNCTVCVKFRWDSGTNAFVPIPASDNWAYTSQNACSASGPGGPPDRIGVYLQLTHYGFTKLVFNSVNIADSSILTLEPIPLLNGCS